MYKDYIISAMGAVLAVRSMPKLAAMGPQVQVAAFAGFFIPLLFFCLFCDICVQKRHHRERQLEEHIRKLR